jgi:NADPH-dependent F420 reductase
LRIGIVGGTGDEGFGLALRLARAGHEIVILDGTSNEGCVATSEVTFVTVPYEGQAEIYRSIKTHVPAGRILVDTTTPLATAVGGRPWQVVRPWHGSAAEQAEALLGRGAVRLISGFHTISAEQLQDLERDMEGDVLLCGQDAEAKATVGGLIESIPSLRWVDVGDLTMARVIEPLTALMVSVNRRYKLKDTGVALTGRTSWGRPDA